MGTVSRIASPQTETFVVGYYLFYPFLFQLTLFMDYDCEWVVRCLASLSIIVVVATGSIALFRYSMGTLSHIASPQTETFVVGYFFVRFFFNCHFLWIATASAQCDASQGS